MPDARVNLQKAGGSAKPYQARRIVRCLKKLKEQTKEKE